MSSWWKALAASATVATVVARYSFESWSELAFSAGYHAYNSRIGYYVNCLDEPEAGHHQTAPRDCSAYTVVPLAIKSSNYAYLIIDNASRTALAVDPADPRAVLSAAAAHDVKLEGILTTHRHWDHSGGNARLCELLPGIQVYGSAADQVDCLTTVVADGDVLDFGALRVTVIASPFHTVGHVMFAVSGRDSSDTPSLFSGDAIFVAGCGRFFEGSASGLFRTVQRLATDLPPDTLLWPGHEYARSNLAFAQYVEPGNAAVVERLAKASMHEERMEAMIPSTLEEERRTNPFFRADVVRLPGEEQQGDGEGEERVIKRLEELRRLKDGYKENTV